MSDESKPATWDQYFMSLVYMVAMRSKDTRTHIGAVIIGSGNLILATGYNGFPRGMNDHRADRYEKGEKQHWFEHAERNAIYAAAMLGHPLSGATLYTQGIPCEGCTRGVIQCGIKRIVVHEDWIRAEGDNALRYRRSETMLAEVGVAISAYQGGLLLPNPSLDGTPSFALFSPKGEHS